jgi:LacI family transcriptional regulator
VPFLKVTTTNIAKLAGVSQSTVSRVLNGADIRISDAKRKKILDIARGLNYRPNRYARSLKTGKHQVIAVVAYDITDAFAVECVSTMESYFARTQYRVEWISCFHASKEKTDPVQMLSEISQTVDGIIIIEANTYLTDADLLKFWASADTPLITIIRNVPGDMISSVMIDDEKGTIDLVKHLVDLGHRDIAFCYHKHHAPTADTRYKTFLRLIPEFGLNKRKELQIPIAETAKDGYQAGNHLLKLKDRPTAVICYKDLAGIGFIKACYDNGVDVPKTISVASFDNIRIAESVSPGITTVAADYEEIAKRAIDELTNQIEKAQKPQPIHVVTPPRLIIRQSTCPAPE